MKDQLAFYLITTEQLEKLPEMDLIVDGEVADYLERKGRFHSDLFLDGEALGDVLSGLTTIMGAPLDGLIGGSGMAIEPSGPTIYTSHIKAGDLRLMIKTLGKARSLLGGNVQRGEEEQAKRLTDLAESLGAKDALRGALQRVQRYLEGAQNLQGVLISVYSRWS